MSFPPAHWVKIQSRDLYRADGTDQIKLCENGVFEVVVIPENTWVTRCKQCWAEFNQRAHEASQYGMEIHPDAMLLMLNTILVTRFDYQDETLVGSCLRCGTTHWLEKINMKEERL